MSNYKINRNKKPLDDQQIEKHKNFSKMMSDYQKIHSYQQATKPLYKNVKFMSLVVVIFTIVLIFVLEHYEKEQDIIDPKKDSVQMLKDSIRDKNDSLLLNSIPVPENNYSGNNPTPNDPAVISLPANLKIPFVTKKVKASEGAILYLQNGTRLIIPPLAFKDKNGRVLEDEVEIRYREFRNPADFFMGNISMHFSGSGENSVFLESAGMFEVRGYKNGEALLLNKNLTAELITLRNSNDYSLYRFNENGNTWEKTANDNVKRTFSLATMVNERDNISVANEVAVYAGIEWVLDASVKEDLYQALLRGDWYKFSVQDKNNDQVYEMSIGNGSKTHTFLATLQQVQTDPEKHRQWMIDKFKEYNAARNRTILLNEKEKQRLKEYLQSPEYKEYLKWKSSPEGRKAQLNASVLTTFTINNFGLWNCDRPEKLPTGITANASFQDEKGTRLTPTFVYLVDYNKNSVFTYYEGAFNKFSFNPASENMIWFVMDQKHIGIVDKEKMKNIAVLSGSCIFNVKTVDVSGYTPEALRKLLGMPSHITTTQQIKAQNQPGKPDKVVVISPLVEPDMPQ